MKRYITAMALSKQTVIDQLSNAGGEVIEHLIKLYLFPNTEYVNHWRKEVWSFLHKVPKLKGSNKFPDAELIEESILGYGDIIQELIPVVKDEYNQHTPQRADAYEAENAIIAYLEWLSSVLAAKGVVAPSETYTKLDELGF